MLKLFLKYYLVVLIEFGLLCVCVGYAFVWLLVWGDWLVKPMPYTELLTVLRYYSKRYIPIAMFTVFILSHNFFCLSEPHNSRCLNYVSDAILALLLFAIVFLLVGYSHSHTPKHFLEYVGFRWRFDVALEWIGLYLGSYILYSMRGLRNRFAIANLSLQSVSAGGWLHEMAPALLLTRNLFMLGDSSFPMMLNTQLISVFLLIYLLKTVGWKPAKTFYFTLGCYVTFSILLCILPASTFQHCAPLMRLPTIFLLATLPLGIKKVET